MWRKYGVTDTFTTLMSCHSVCCMCGEASSSRWLITQLTNGQHACVLLFVPVIDIFEHTLWLSVFVCTWWTLFHTTLDAVGNNLKWCDVMFHFITYVRLTSFSYMCKNVLPAYSSAKIIKKSKREMYCHVFNKTNAVYYPVRWRGSAYFLSDYIVIEERRIHERHWCYTIPWLVAWHSGITSVFGRRNFPVLRSTYSWQVPTYMWVNGLL